MSAFGGFGEEEMRACWIHFGWILGWWVVCEVSPSDMLVTIYEVGHVILGLSIRTQHLISYHSWNTIKVFLCFQRLSKLVYA